MLTVRGLLTMMELQGHQFTTLESPYKPPQSIQSSHAFGEPLSALKDLEKPLIEQVLTAGRKLRSDRLATRSVYVNLRHGYLSRDHGYLGSGADLGSPISSDRDLIAAALHLLKRIYQEDKIYTQSGVYLTDFSGTTFRQRLLFDDEEQIEREKHERVAEAVDRINEALGKRAVFPAALLSNEKKWRPKREYGADAKIQ
jgi:hypothetical protein